MEKYIVGIDGCKFGWIAVKIDQKGIYEISKHAHFSSVIESYPLAEKYLVDMVIGLSDDKMVRETESLARQFLKPFRTSSVFSPPCRAAVYQSSYDLAKEVNKKTLGKSFSIQAWNIVPKIKEVDEFLFENKTLQGKIFEAHPEVCFAGLNEGLPMKFKKKEKDGIRERIDLLENIFPIAKEIFEEGKSKFLKKDVLPDDVLDALGLAISGLFGIKYGFSFVDPNSKFDQRNLEMNMIYFDIKKALYLNKEP